MNNSLVNQTLIEIEQNLKDLESARSQVNSVSESSQKMVRTINSLITQFDHAQKEFIEDNKGVSNQVNTAMEFFKNTLETSAKKSIKVSSDVLQKHEIQIEKTIELFKNTLETSAKNSIKLSSEVHLKHENEIGKTIELFKNTLEISAKNAIKVSSGVHQKHEIEIGKTIDKLSELQKATLELKRDLSGFDLDMRFSSVLNSLKSFETEMNAVKSKLGSIPAEMRALAELQIKEQQEGNANLEIKLDSIKSSNQITQIVIVIATIILGALVLIF